ncbi:MAG TPA: phospho-sugar mutase [Candidatus Scatomorpha stercorigallinarum]|nr:phospho-sugar mutase [Candidatus Scatomorpha stercorigallinarum]
MDIRAEYSRWLERAVDDSDLIEELRGLDPDGGEVSDRFYRDLAFGTGGLRGVLGAGTNRMNIYTVRRATQGLCAWLKASGGTPSVAIAHDSRIKSNLFAREAARVLAANDVTAWIYPRLEPTPALSWAVRYFHCGAGICVTASHNPAKYNGYKVYGPDGGQITLEAAEHVQAAIDSTDPFDGVALADFDAAVADGRIRYIPEQCLEDFLDAVQKLSLSGGAEDLSVVYTPLNGSGLECVSKILSRIGVKDVTVVPEQEHPDGRFPTCPYPNPEEREAMQRGLELCEKLHPDLLLGTDPDCDRMGSAVPEGDGYRLLTGNEMGVLLLDYICRRRMELGTMPEKPVAVTTIVSTDMADAVAAEYGVELRRVLTGFKFIGEQIGLLEAEGHGERFLFGFEESYGYLSGSHVRDKDAVNASMLCCEMAAWYKKQGMTLADAIRALYEKHGYTCCAVKSFAFEGEGGMERMAAVMDSLRAAPPAEIAGRAVTGRTDYQTGEGVALELPRSNVLEYRMDGAKLIVRPSGTEPKIKVYLSARAESMERAQEIDGELAQAAAGFFA